MSKLEHEDKAVISAESSQSGRADEVWQSDIRRLGKGAGIALLGRVVGRVLLLANQVILARVLGPSDFGLYALGWTVLQMGSLIAPLGLDRGVIRYGSQYWGKDSGRFRAVLQWSLLLVLLTGGGAGLMLAAVAPWLAASVFKSPSLVEVFRGFAVALVLASVLRVAAAGTRISQRMTFSAVAEDVSPSAIQLVGALLFVVVLGWGIGGAVFSAVLGFAVAAALAGIFLWQLFGVEVRQTQPAVLPMREYLSFSLSASLAGIFVMLTMQVDRLLVGYFLPASEVGVYQVASQVAMLSSLILSSFNAIFTPMIARLYQEGAMQRLNELFKVSTKWGLCVSLPMFLVLAVASRETMRLIFGAAYAPGAAPMLIMAGAQLFNAATGAVGLLLIMSGYQTRWLSMSMLAFVVNLILGVLLIPRLGINGAALAVATSVVLLFGGGLIQVRRLLGLWPYDWRYVKVLFASAVALAVLIAGKILIPQEARNLIWLAGLTSLAILAFSAALFYKPDREDRELLSRLMIRCRRLLGG